MNLYFKQILLPLKSQISFVLIKNEKILVLKTLFNTQKYIKLPELPFFKKKNLLILPSNRLEPSLNSEQLNSLHFLSRWLKTFSKPIRKQLLLKGLGLRGTLSIDERFLELKLGFSHLIKVSTALKELKISMTNTLLVVEGIESATVGNFLKRIRNLKTPDSYKGKGFWYKNESKILKEIKKT
jgi:hypothetical protein